jgi:hypothetical protein
MPRLLLSGDLPQESRRLRDGGHEVVVLGDGVSAEQVAAVAVQEDVVAVGVSDPELGRVVADSLGGTMADPSGGGVVVFWVTSDLRPSSPPEDRD